MRSASATKLCVLLFFFLFVFSLLNNVAFGYRGEGEGEGRGGDEEEERGRGEKRDIFILPKSKQVMRSEAGEFRVVRGVRQRGVQSPMHIGFINMEPKSLYLPQYLDSALILFVRSGNAKIGWIHKDGLVEKNLKIGDVYRIPAGSTFYIVNTDEGQILQIVCGIDTSESLGMGVFQSFFIGGGIHPVSILAGFDENTLKTAFNVSSMQLEHILSTQQGGPMVFMNGTHNSEKLASFMQLKHQERVKDEDEDDDEDNNGQGQDSWIWRKLMNFVVNDNASKKSKKSSESTDAYNLYNRAPDFENNYGSSRALTHEDYSPLGHAGDYGIGVYLVNLTAGAMMAPHVNPTATEYGIVLRGSGSIQIVYPNGTSAMNAEVNEGDVFWVPRYFPFCHIASRHGTFEFFGFTTSARENRPQFLVGTSSILQTIKGPELAAAFGVSEDRFNKLINSQSESIILPSAPVAPPHEHEEEGKHHKAEDRDGLVIELWE